MTKEQLVTLHSFSVKNREAVEKQQNGGYVACFYCVEFLPAVEIAQYCLDENKQETTAICPRCNVDAILAVPITKKILQELHDRYFTATE